MAGLPGHKHWLDTICSEKSAWTSGIACNIEESRLNASILESDGDACNADCGIYNNYVFNKLTHIQVCLVAAFCMHGLALIAIQPILCRERFDHIPVPVYLTKITHH